MDKVTVVTVCYNAEKTIEDTVKSVLAQTYKNLEYLIIDGASADATLQIVEDYRPLFAEKGIAFRVISEKDSGIYNAMNKGIEKASGEWILFMNADDCFYDGEVINDIFQSSSYEGYAAVYGDGHRADQKGSYYTGAEPIDILPKKMPFIHQAVFTRKAVCQKYRFDETYQLCADYDMFFRMYADGMRFCRVRRIVCRYFLGGASAKQLTTAQNEVIRIKLHFQDRFPVSRKERLGWKADRIVRQLKGMLPPKMMSGLRALRYLMKSSEEH